MGDLEQLLYRESRLLDEGRFEQWLELFSGDATYWIPVGDTRSDPQTQLSLVYDDRSHLEDRVWRLTQSRGPSQEPAFTTVHLVSNVEPGVPAADGTLTVRSCLVVFEERAGQTGAWSGRCEHDLVPCGESWLIAAKRVHLLQRGRSINNLTILL